LERRVLKAKRVEDLLAELIAQWLAPTFVRISPRIMKFVSELLMRKWSCTVAGTRGSADPTAPATSGRPLAHSPNTEARRL
jgi:hypothetical protein